MNCTTISHISGTLDGRKRAALIIRHAERHQVHSVMDSLGVGLTEKGMRDAREFGAKLPKYHYYRIFHSPALRCKETADEIADGIRSKGGIVSKIEEGRSLCSPYVRDERCLREADRLGNDFMREWLEGRVDSSWIDGAESSAIQVLNPILEKMLDGQDHIDIHVSHDWDVMLLRETVMGISHEKAGWLCFLDGMVFFPIRKGFEAGYRDERRVFEIREGRILKE